MAGTLEPKWNQTFIYAPMKRNDVKTQSLQMTVYDYDRIGSGEYVGEVRATGAKSGSDRLVWFTSSYSFPIHLQVAVV